MELAQLVGHLSENLLDRLGIERRAIRGDPFELQGALIQRALQASQQGGDVVMVRLVIEPLIPPPLLLPIVSG